MYDKKGFETLKKSGIIINENIFKYIKNDGLNKSYICSQISDVKKFILNNEFLSIKSVESQEFELNLKTQIPKLVFDKNIKQAEKEAIIRI